MFKAVSDRLGLSLRREQTGNWLSAQTGTWILEGTVDGVELTARETYLRVGARRGRRFEIVARARREFSERRVDQSSSWTRVCERNTVRVNGAPVFDAEELERLIRWACEAGEDTAPAPAESPVDPLQTSVSRYGDVFGFSAEELEANRSGLVHPTQASRADRAHRRTVLGHGIVATVLLVMGLGLAAWYDAKVASPTSQVDQNATKMIVAGFCFLSAVVVVFGLAAWLRERSRRTAHRGGRAQTFEGPAEVVVLRGRRGSGDVRVLKVGGRSFMISKDEASALIPGARYRVHCAADQILSLEEDEPSAAQR